MTRPYLTLGQAVNHLLTVIIILIALSMPAGLIGHAFDLDIGANPLILGLMNVLAIGYVVRQSVVADGGDYERSLPVSPVDTRLVVPMVFALFGSAILISELDNITVALYPIPEDWAAPLIDLSTGKHGWLSTIFLLNIVAPVTEEFLFRGIILRGFLGAYSARNAILLSAFLFAAFHLNPWQGIGAFLLGLLFGWWYVRTRSLLPCLVGHALFNAIPVVVYGVLVFPHPDLSGPPEFQPLWLNALGIMLLGGGIVITSRLFAAQAPIPRNAWRSQVDRFSAKLRQYARDDYGPETTTLFVSQIDAQTDNLPSLSTTLYQTPSQKATGPAANNLLYDSSLIRLLYGLTDYTGNGSHAEAADDYLAYYLERLPLPSGYFPWGIHQGYDTVEDDIIEGPGTFRSVYPPWDRLWAIDPEAVVRQAEALRDHFPDPEKSLAFDRHYPPRETLDGDCVSAGSWIALWSFVYGQTQEERYQVWATELADDIWSRRHPSTDLISESIGGNQARVEPLLIYAVHLLRSHQELGDSGLRLRDQAMDCVRALTSRLDANESGHHFGTFDLETGKPVGARSTSGWEVDAGSATVGVSAPIGLAYAYHLTGEDDFKDAFDRLSPLFQIDTFTDTESERQSIPASLLARAIDAWTNVHVASMDYAYLAPAAILGHYAAKHYSVNDWFVCGPPTNSGDQDDTLTGWETYSNRGGSADLALSLLRLASISEGRYELIDHDPIWLT